LLNLYSLGSFYTDDNIKKRISRRQAYLKTQKERAKERKEKRKATYEAMSPAEKRLDKSKLKISTMRDTSQGISHEKIGLQKWSNVQNARRMQQIQNERDLKELQRHQKEIDTYLGKKHEDI
jgi:hypothetical protein